MDNRNFIPTEVFLNFLFRFSEPALPGVIYGQWGRTRKTGLLFTFFLLAFLLFKEKRKEFTIYYFKIIRLCLGQVTYFALTACFIILEIWFRLCFIDSFHIMAQGQGLKIAEVPLLKSEEGTIELLGSSVNRSINYFFGMLKKDYFISFIFHFLLLTWFSFSNIRPSLFFFHWFDSNGYRDSYWN